MTQPPLRQEIPVRSLDLLKLDIRLHQMIDFLSADLSKNWIIEELAAQCGMSKRHLERLCKAQTGFTPVRLIKLLKLEQAREDLTHSLKGIKLIAVELGYPSDTSHFSHDFKDEYGSSPREWRKLYWDLRSKSTAH